MSQFLSGLAALTPGGGSSPDPSQNPVAISHPTINIAPPSFNLGQQLLNMRDPVELGGFGVVAPSRLFRKANQPTQSNALITGKNNALVPLLLTAAGIGAIFFLTK